jgi:hypothetical protein
MAAAEEGDPGLMEEGLGSPLVALRSVLDMRTRRWREKYTISLNACGVCVCVGDEN